MHGTSVPETISLEVIIVLLLRLTAFLKLDRGSSSDKNIWSQFAYACISIETSLPPLVGVQQKAEDES